MHHYMSPAMVVIVLVCAALIDWSAFGPDSLRDRVAFVLYATGIWEGWNGGPVDAWTLDKLRELLKWGLSSPVTKGSYIQGAATGVNFILCALVAIVFVYAMACVMPRWLQNRLAKTKMVGRFVVRQFPTSQASRINWKLLILAAILGLFSDLPQGGLGAPAEWCIVHADMVVNTAFGWLFING